MSNTTVIQLRSIRSLLDKLRPELTGKTLSRLTAMLDVMSPAGSLSLERALQVTFDHIPAEGRLKQFTNFLSDINAGIKEAGITDTTIAVLGGKFDRAADRTVIFHGPDRSGERASEHTRKTTELPPRQPDVDNDLQPERRKPVRVFLSYSHDDYALVSKIRGMLAPHLNGDPDFQFITWQDNQILAGEKWDDRIGSALSACDAGFFMASASFCASKYIVEKELRHFRETGKPFVLIGANKCDLKILKMQELDEHQVFRLSRQAGGKARWFSELTAAPDKREFVLQLAKQITERIKQIQPPHGPTRPTDASAGRTTDESCTGIVPLGAKGHTDVPPVQNPNDSSDAHPDIPHTLVGDLAPTFDHVAWQLANADPDQISDAEHQPSDAQTVDLTKPYAHTAEGRQDLHTRGLRVNAQEFILKWARDQYSTPYFVLLGEAGVGKTTTLQKLSRHLLRDRRADQSLPLPIYIDLRNFTGRPTANAAIKVEQVINDALSRAWNTTEDSGFTPGDALRLVREGGALMLFDGLDEKIVHLEANLGVELIQALWSALPPSLIHADREARKEGKTDLPNRGKILISCRSHYFRDLLHQSSHFIGHGREIVTEQDYSAATILPFSEQQIAEYLGKFLGSDRVEGALEIIRSVHNLSDLAPRPLLLKTIASHIPKLESDMAAGRTVRAASLYDYMVDDWLNRDTGKHVIESDHKPWFMEEIAARLWLSDQKQCSWKTLHAWFDQILASNLVLQSAYIGKDRTTLKDDLRTATFLVRKDGSDGDAAKSTGGFRFAHTSMQEYFLARYLYRALLEGGRTAWALRMPTLETFDFLGDLLLLRDDSAQALKGLAALLERNTPLATVNAFRYWVRAMEKGAPQPQPTRVVLAGENLSRWRIGVQSRQGSQCRTENQPNSGSGASQTVPDENSKAAIVEEVARARLEISPTLHIPSLDLSGANLSNSCWSHVAIPNATLNGTFAADALFRNCDFTGAVWTDSDFAQCDFVNAIGLPNPMADGLQRAWCAPGNTEPWERMPRILSGGENAPHQLSCAWSPDGKRFVSSSDDNTARVWCAETGRQLAVLLGHKSAVWCGEWSPDGKRLASGSADHTLRIWDSSTGRQIGVFRGHRGTVVGCAWSPDGQRVVTASSDKTLRVWDIGKGRHLVTLYGHTSGVHSCDWDPTGTRIVSASNDNTLRLWWADKGVQIDVLDGHEEPVWRCRWSPDGKRILSSSADKTVRMWDLKNRVQIMVLDGHRERVFGCCWSPDGNRIASSSGDGALRIWDTDSGQQIDVLSGHTFIAYSCAWSPDGRFILTASADNTLRLWDVSAKCATLVFLTTITLTGAAVNLRRNVLITDAGDTWQHWRWKVEGTPASMPATLPLEAFSE